MKTVQATVRHSQHCFSVATDGINAVAEDAALGARTRSKSEECQDASQKQAGTALSPSRGRNDQRGLHQGRGGGGRPGAAAPGRRGLRPGEGGSHGGHGGGRRGAGTEPRWVGGGAAMAGGGWVAPPLQVGARAL